MRMIAAGRDKCARSGAHVGMFASAIGVKSLTSTRTKRMAVAAGRMADWRVKRHGAAPPAATRRRGRDLCTIVRMARRAAPGITARATRVGEAVLQRR